MIASPFAITRFDHVVLRARGMAAMERFYCDVLGCAVVKRQKDGALVHLSAGPVMIDLVDVASGMGLRGGAGPGRDGRNMDHMCLGIEPFDEAAITAHLRAHGIACGPAQRRFGAEGWGRSIYLEDPEGNTVELKGPAEGQAEI